MSFLSELKNQILSQPYKSACCRRSMLNGIVFAKGENRDGTIHIALENSEAISYTITLVKEFFGKDTEPYTSERGGRRRLLSFTSPACARYLDGITNNGILPFSQKCEECKSAFLRGIFLACGRVTNPKKRYRLELAPGNTADILRVLLAGLGIEFSIADQRSERILYTGNSGALEDFFALIGMNSTAFLLMNSKIENEFKNNANRIRNCETNNISKTVSAAAKCIEAIEALEEANLLSTLPEELEKTAKLRLLYRDYSLARLAAEFTPAISKPGLSHRLNKIMEMSEKLLSDK